MPGHSSPQPRLKLVTWWTFGNFSQSRFFNTVSDDSYVTRRSKNVESALRLFKTNKTVLILSRLAGKFMRVGGCSGIR